MSSRKPMQFNTALRHVPERLLTIKLSCPNCQTTFAPDWLNPNYEDLGPIKPKYSFGREPYDGPGRWIPTGVGIRCPFCDTRVLLSFPVEKNTGKGLLFGDEAYRDYRDKFVYTYSLVGADHKLITNLDHSIRALKKRLCSSRDPNSWHFHMKELCHFDHRKKHKIFRDWDRTKIELAIDSLSDTLKATPDLFVYNISLTQEKINRAFANNFTRFTLRNSAYILLVLNVIDEFTGKAARPEICFDAEKRSVGNKIIQAWARDVFLNSRRCLAYAFVARGIEIKEPEFVKASLYPCLELADFVSYVVARYHLKKWQNEKIEMDPIRFGTVTYFRFDEYGNLLRERQEGYPWDIFHR